MDKTPSSTKSLCLVAFIVLAICSVSTLLIVLYTNNQMNSQTENTLLQMIQRVVKLEDKLQQLEFRTNQSHIQQASLLVGDSGHRVKRNTPTNLSGLQNRVKALEIG